VEEILAQLDERSAGGLAGSTGGRYFGYVTGASLPAAAIVEAWTAAVDQNTGMWPLGPAAVELELVTLRWLAELLEFPGASGYFGSGATMANTICLAVARHWFGRQHGVDVKQQGVRALPELAVYGSDELHLSDHKALRTLGLGSGCVRPVPIDADYRMRVEPLVEAIERDRSAGVVPAIVIAQAGSVNTGASDPLAEIADVCERYGLWLHVDGAFGAFFRLCERTAPLVRGMERADSLTVASALRCCAMRSSTPRRSAAPPATSRPGPVRTCTSSGSRLRAAGAERASGRL
jgi:aromatic-L-amino-acid decarboxylase